MALNIIRSINRIDQHLYVTTFFKLHNKISRNSKTLHCESLDHYRKTKIIKLDYLQFLLIVSGALEEEKQYLLNCQPEIQFEVKGETITITYTQNPSSQPDVKADVSFKLGEEFEFQPEGHLLQVCTSTLYVTYEFWALPVEQQIKI